MEDMIEALLGMRLRRTRFVFTVAVAIRLFWIQLFQVTTVGLLG